MIINRLRLIHYTKSYFKSLDKHDNEYFDSSLQNLITFVLYVDLIERENGEF